MQTQMNSSHQDQRGPPDKAGSIEAHKWNHSGGKKEISLKKQSLVISAQVKPQVKNEIRLKEQGYFL